MTLIFLKQMTRYSFYCSYHKVDVKSIFFSSYSPWYQITGFIKGKVTTFEYKNEVTMNFLNYPFSPTEGLDASIINKTNTKTLLEFILKHYKLSKKEVAEHLEVTIAKLNDLLTDESTPSSVMRDKIVRLLK